MHPEEIFARRVAQRLDDGLQVIPQHIQARLNQAREKAVLSSKGHVATHVGQGALALNLGFLRQRMAFAALAGLLAMMALAAQYGRIQATADEAADIDEVILSDDAPVQAYVDPAFSAVFRRGLLKQDAPDRP